VPDIRESTSIVGVHIVTPDVWGDDRGQFVETFRREWIPGVKEMIQANRADRRADALVGLHYHLHQADYWYVPVGRALVALHDLRVGSPTEATSEVIEIGQHDHRGVYIPRGVAHGFYSLTDMTITYLVDGYYDPTDELGVVWDDPALAIEWPGREPTLSERDRRNPRRDEIPEHLRPRYSKGR
jgi:dTDP-4-dehydrorhamnose 3,5-epimerase